GRGTGEFRPYLNAAAAQAYLEAAPLEPPQRGIIGTGESVSGELISVANIARANELFLLSITDSLETRINSYRLIEQAMEAISEDLV
ncbi:MAG: hypothetical protein AAFR82_05150, partial [Pseudomonadota bacterium]